MCSNFGLRLKPTQSSHCFEYVSFITFWYLFILIQLHFCFLWIWLFFSLNPTLTQTHTHSHGTFIQTINIERQTFSLEFAIEFSPMMSNVFFLFLSSHLCRLIETTTATISINNSYRHSTLHHRPAPETSHSNSNKTKIAIAICRHQQPLLLPPPPLPTHNRPMPIKIWMKMSP